MVTLHKKCPKNILPARWSGAALWEELLIGMAGLRVDVDGLIEGGVEVLHEALHPLNVSLLPRFLDFGTLV